MHVHITGASGSGTSTLGRALAASAAAIHFDTDDFYWLPTDPPYRQSRPMPERLDRLRAALDVATGGWVVSGSLDGWGDPLVPRFALVVCLWAPAGVRVARLRAREQRDFGALVAPGGAMHDDHEAFVAWAAGYDDGTLAGRSRPRQEAWLARLPCPVLRLDGTAPVAALLERVMAVLGRYLG